MFIALLYRRAIEAEPSGTKPLQLEGTSGNPRCQLQFLGILARSFCPQRGVVTVHSFEAAMWGRGAGLVWVTLGGSPFHDFLVGSCNCGMAVVGISGLY